MAGRIVSEVDIGRTVLCDYCNEDYTDSERSGGFLFGSYGICPACAPLSLERIVKYGEEDGIVARCEEGESFGDFIRRIRGPEGGKQTITAYDTASELLDAMKPRDPLSDAHRKEALEAWIVDRPPIVQKMARALPPGFTFKRVEDGKQYWVLGFNEQDGGIVIITPVNPAQEYERAKQEAVYTHFDCLMEGFRTAGSA